MTLALQIQSELIPCKLILQQLDDTQLLPQLVREMVVEETIERVAKEHQINLTFTPIEFERLSQQITELTAFQGMNSTQIAAITTRTLKLQKFKQARWGDKISSYYELVKERLQRVTYAIIQVEDNLIAQELFFRIQSCELSFSELADKYSQDRSAQNGGLVESILLTEVEPAIVTILARLKPGELSPLFKLNGYYTLLRLTEFKLPELDENIQQVLLDELFEDWLQTQLDPN